MSFVVGCNFESVLKSTLKLVLEISKFDAWFLFVVSAVHCAPYLINRPQYHDADMSSRS